MSVKAISGYRVQGWYNTGSWVRRGRAAESEEMAMHEGELTHLDAAGHARMVDVGAKEETRRTAVARGLVRMLPSTLALITAGGLPKGDVLATARIAGIMAAKRTSELIPLCHPLMLTHVAVNLTPDPAAGGVQIEVTVSTRGQTGVEMEALTGASVAGLTIYDMCKAVDRGMQITDIRVVRKTGGKSGDWGEVTDD